MYELLTVADVAKILHISTVTAYRLVNRPDGPPIRRLPGRLIRIDAKEFQTWLNRLGTGRGDSNVPAAS